MSNPTTYPISRVKYRLAFQINPQETRHHNAIFIQTSPSPSPGSGEIIEINGSVTDGYTFIRRPACRPEDDPAFFAREELGYVNADEYPEMAEGVLGKLPVPTRPQQRWRGGGVHGGWERCREDGTFFAEGDVVPRFFRCTEWVEELAMPALRRSGLVRGMEVVGNGRQEVLGKEGMEGRNAKTEFGK